MLIIERRDKITRMYRCVILSLSNQDRMCCNIDQRRMSYSVLFDHFKIMNIFVVLQNSNFTSRIPDTNHLDVQWNYD